MKSGLLLQMIRNKNLPDGLFRPLATASIGATLAVHFIRYLKISFTLPVLRWLAP